MALIGSDVEANFIQSNPMLCNMVQCLPCSRDLADMRLGEPSSVSFLGSLVQASPHNRGPFWTCNDPNLSRTRSPKR